MLSRRDRSGLGRLHLVRLAVALVGILLLLLAADGERETPPLPFFLLIGICLVNIGYFLVEARSARTGRLASLQVVLDWTLVTSLVYLTGGVYSFAVVLYFGGILAAALGGSERLGLLTASLATVSLAAVQILYHLAGSEVLALPLVSEGTVYGHSLRVGSDAAYLIAQGVGLHLVALLGAWLSRELQHVEVLYGDILEHMAEGLVVVDASDRIVFVNGEARRLLSYHKSGEVLGEHLRRVFRRREDHALLGCLLSRRPVVLDLEVATREGPRSVQVKTTVLRDERGGVRGTIGILTDLTLRRQVEAAERQTARLEELQTLALGIAHEVRNPLASIRGCVQELARQTYLGEDERQLADIVCRESDRLDRIVADFMSFARMRPPSLSGCDLASLLRDVVLLLQNRGPEGGPRIALECPEGAAPAQADRELLQQVFLNLGLNACEAAGAGGSVRVHLRPARIGIALAAGSGCSTGRRLEEVEGYEVSVEDDGPGIAPSDLGQVFIPFFTTKTGGTGLGLPMAERIVKAHGGEITAESAMGEGARFVVRLPRAARPERQPLEQAPAPAGDRAEAPAAEVSAALARVPVLH